jgi:hypothetical protein
VPPSGAALGAEMPTVCAWCNKPLPGGTNEPGPISHGICESCAVNLEYQPQPMEAFLESLTGPVMAVDSDVRVVGTNERVLALVAKRRSGVLQRLGGEVISCVYSELPGGCGHTEHCLGCSIRGAVNETRQTGQPKRAAPAFAYVRTPEGGVSKIELRISTECAGNLVLLRVDEAATSDPDA